MLCLYIRFECARVYCWRWGSICWFSTSLIFCLVIFGLPACHLFLLSGWTCLSEDINNHKQYHDSFTAPYACSPAMSLSCTPSCLEFIFPLHGFDSFQCVGGANQTYSVLVSVKQHLDMQHITTYTEIHSHCPWLLPWLNVCSPITDSNYRQSPCVSITSQHNALIRLGLI